MRNSRFLWGLLKWGLSIIGALAFFFTFDDLLNLSSIYPVTALIIPALLITVLMIFLVKITHDKKIIERKSEIDQAAFSQNKKELLILKNQHELSLQQAKVTTLENKRKDADFSSITDECADLMSFFTRKNKEAIHEINHIGIEFKNEVKLSDNEKEISIHQKKYGEQMDDFIMHTASEFVQRFKRYVDSEWKLSGIQEKSSVAILTLGIDTKFVFHNNDPIDKKVSIGGQEITNILLDDDTRLLVNQCILDAVEDNKPSETYKVKESSALVNASDKNILFFSSNDLSAESPQLYTPPPEIYEKALGMNAKMNVAIWYSDPFSSKRYPMGFVYVGSKNTSSNKLFPEKRDSRFYRLMTACADCFSTILHYSALSRIDCIAYADDAISTIETLGAITNGRRKSEPSHGLNET